MTEDKVKRLYVQDVNHWQQRLTKDRFSNRKLNVKVIERGIILPPRRKEVGYAGGVCDNDFNFVAGYTRKDPANGTGGVGFTPILHIPSKEIHSFSLTRT